MHFSHRLHVDLPVSPDEVFALVGDYARDPEWREGVQIIPVPLGIVRDGTRTYEDLRLFGSTQRTVATITDVHPPHSFRFVSEDGNVVGMRSIEPLGSGSRFTVRLRVRLAGFMALLAPILGFVFRKRVERDLVRLAALFGPPRVDAGARVVR